MKYKWFVVSDILGYGTYTKMRCDAEKIMSNLIAHGGTDARIEYDPWK